MIFHVLGPLEVHGPDGEPHRLGHGKAATVLATLLLHPNAWVTSSRLIDETWHQTAAPASAEANLKTYVWQLRRMLPAEGGEPRIESAPGRYRLRLQPGELDTHQVAEHAASARAAADAGEFATAVDALEEALGLWRGRPFEGVVGAADHEADRLGELHHHLREELAEAQLALGRIREAVHTLRALTEEDPLREGAWASLVRALNASGRRAEALRAYGQARRILADELGVGPGEELSTAYRAALGEATVNTRRELPSDAAHFTARAAELATIRGASGGVVLVEGMPGVGKTALAVHAAHGLADAFPDGQFFVDLRACAVVDDANAGASSAARVLDPADVLARLLRRVGVDDASIPDSLDERAALWRSELSRRRVLLVLDDAVGIGQVEPLLPAGKSSLTLITTRNRDWHVDGAVRIGLGPLAEQDAAAMFRAAAGVRAAHEAFDRRGGDDAVEAVVRLCGGVPAAMRDVAARLHSRPMWTSQSLARELRAGPCWVLACTRDGYRRALATAFAQLPPAQRSALRALGELPGEFDLAAAARVLGRAPEAVRPTLEALVDASLLDALSGERYRGHRLVRHYARCQGCDPVSSGTPAARVA
ncbi:winged helix-turn-helix domain-containing protein [Saccharopolyspora erythraea]|uniref:AfsR/SARP family transcriptional regulator n=1 Tax=Saccharopolyspora erythraea TaxID=1836 RepID=UPI001BA8D0DA|nr:BTAD domain-containing putative transcriptional regulator [Saccharopolyspora erythraea]QUH03924.1 winged helix-turn-helix domain-containing protein [Saccharopolyspora erythraea]